jgi:hypothetical protein
MRSTGVLRRLPTLAVLVALLGLAACGGGGSSTATSTSVPGNTIASAGGSRPETGEPRRGSAAREGSASESASEPQASRSPGGGESTEGAEPAESSPGAEGREPREASGTSTSQGSSSAAGASPGAARPHRALTRAGAEAAERAARRKARAAHRRLERKAGAAAPFLVETGDNSIPTYGAEASGGEVAAAEAALSGYLAARAAGEWGSACAKMSAGLQRQLALLAGETGAGDGCAQAYAKIGERIPASGRADPLTGGITALRVESPHAFALFYGPGSRQYMMPLEAEGGAWNVTQLEPVPWPIGSTGE